MRIGGIIYNGVRSTTAVRRRGPVMELDGCPFRDGLAWPGINAKGG